MWLFSRSSSSAATSDSYCATVAPGRVASIRSGFRYCFAIGENFGVRPQVSHTVALTPPVPASRLAAFANEVFETWAAPSFSPPLHQKRITATHTSATKVKLDIKLIIICDASGCGRRFGPDGAIGKAGERPDFRRWHFAVVRLERGKAK